MLLSAFFQNDVPEAPHESVVVRRRCCFEKATQWTSNYQDNVREQSEHKCFDRTRNEGASQ